MKKTALVVLILLVIVVATVFFSHKKSVENKDISFPQQVSFDPKNSSFTIDGQHVTLVNGKSEIALNPDSVTTIKTFYFGNEAHGDLNDDGSGDAAFLVTHTTGGSGVFYYAVAAIKNENGYKTTNAFFVGDRIAPQSTEIRSGKIYVNFAERKAGEPMTAQPSQGVTLLLKVTPEGVLTNSQ